MITIEEKIATGVTQQPNGDKLKWSKAYASGFMEVVAAGLACCYCWGGCCVAFAWRAACRGVWVGVCMQGRGRARCNRSCAAGCAAQGWNKFCYTGGYLEARVKLPGDHFFTGFW